MSKNEEINSRRSIVFVSFLRVFHFRCRVSFRKMETEASFPCPVNLSRDAQTKQWKSVKPPFSICERRRESLATSWRPTGVHKSRKRKHPVQPRKLRLTASVRQNVSLASYFLLAPVIRIAKERFTRFHLSRKENASSCVSPTLFPFDETFI